MRQTKFWRKIDKNVDKKIPNTSIFYLEFNKLTKINFNERMAETSENLASKNEVETSLNLEDKNREEKLQTFDLSFFIDKNYFNNDG